MTNEERHIAVLNRMLESMDVYDSIQPTTERKKAIKAAIKALEQEPQCTEHPCLGTLCKYYKEPCEDAISREAVLQAVSEGCFELRGVYGRCEELINELPSVTPSRHKGHCKDCKYFELDHWAEINGVPVICAHEICTKWCSGVKTSSDGYCHLFEEMESDK